MQLFATPWTAGWQAPLSMGFSRQDTGIGCHELHVITFWLDLHQYHIFLDWNMSENVWCLRLIWLEKLIIRLPLSSSFSGSWSFLSCSFLYTTLLCPLILSHFLCSWSLFCRLQDPSCSWSGVYPLGVRLVKRLVPYPLEGGFVCCYCDQSLRWILKGTSPLLCGCHCPVCGEVCSLVGGTEPLDLFLWFWSVWRQVGLENTPCERSPWGLLLWGKSPQGVFCASPSCLVWALMWPWLALRLAPP